MKGRKILLAFIISAITLTSGCANGTSKTEEAKSEQKTTEENAVVPIKPIPAELWHIQEEDGTLPDKLTEDTLYEVHVMVEDGGEFDLSDTEKEIKIAVILGNK